MLCLKIARWVANSVGPDEMLYSAASHLGLHYLLRPICPNTYGKYGICILVPFDVIWSRERLPLGHQDNSDPHQTMLSVVTDVKLHYFLRPVCSNTQDKYSNLTSSNKIF